MVVSFLPARAVTTTRLYHNSCALLIGINDYGNLPKDKWLTFAANDVTDMKEVLTTQYGFDQKHVTVLTNAQATKANILKALSAMSDTRNIDPEDRILIYFSGHGQTVKVRSGGEMGFLLPTDARVDLVNPTNAAPYLDSCISMEMLWQYLEPSPAKHILVLVDACYSGFLAQARGIVDPNNALALETLATKRALQVITAGRKGEATYEKPKWGHGAFTFKLLEELRARAATEKPFTAHELYAGLLWSVTNVTGGRQSPQMANRETEGEFLFLPGGATTVASGQAAPPAGTSRGLDTFPEPMVVNTAEQFARLPLGKAFDAEGVGVGYPIDARRDQAIQRAVRAALEAAVGLYLPEDVQRANQQLLDEHIYRDLARFVPQYEVLKEAAGDNLKTATVRAYVQVDEVHDAIAAMADNLRATGNVRIALTARDADGADVSPAAVAAMADRFIRAGYQVRAEEKATATGLGRDLTIAGQLTCQQPTRIAQNPDLYLCTATLSATAAQSGTGYVVAAGNARVSKTAFSPDSATKMAQDAVVAKWLEEALPTLRIATLDPCRHFTVRVVDGSSDTLLAVNAALAASVTVRSTDLVSVGNDGSAEITVEFLGKAQELVKMLTTMPKSKLQVKRMEGTEIDVTCAN